MIESVNCLQFLHIYLTCIFLDMRRKVYDKPRETYWYIYERFQTIRGQGFSREYILNHVRLYLNGDYRSGSCKCVNIRYVHFFLFFKKTLPYEC